MYQPRGWCKFARFAGWVERTRETHHLAKPSGIVGDESWESPSTAPYIRKQHVVESSPGIDCQPPRGRVLGPWRIGSILILVSASLVAAWTIGTRRHAEAWLSLDRPNSVTVRQGRSVVDLYLSPDHPVKLLISNLGHSSQSSLMTVRAVPLSGTPQYRPTPLDTNLFVSAKATNRTRGDGEVTAEPRRPNDDGRLIGSAGAPPSLPLGRGHSTKKPLTAPRLAVELPQPPANRDFWLHVTAEPLEDSRGYQRVRGRLAVTRQSVQVYVDSSLHTSKGCPQTIQDLALEIGQRLELTVLPEIGSLLGTVADVDRDGRLTVLITPWLSRLRGGETQVRGFVRSSDFREDIVSPFGNHADVLYLNSDLPAGTGLQTLLLHEVTHAALFSIGFAQGVTDRSAVKSDHHPRLKTKHVEWDDWLNEGLAHLVEKSAGGDWSNMDYRIARYWQRPAMSPLIVGDYYRCGRWRDHGCRGATFLFLDWCEQQYAARGRADFIAAVATSGRTGIDAVEKVMGRNVEELYRAWAVSLAKHHNAGVNSSRIGRFSASGPRSLDWNVSRSNQHTCDITGTATQFVELRSNHPQWYRLSFDGDAQQPWQVTLLNSSHSTPAFELVATWDDDHSAHPARLVVLLSQPVPVGWQIDRVACEQIREPLPRVWDWSAEELSVARPNSTATWRVPQRAVALSVPDLDLESSSAVIKVRLKQSTGQIAWAWCDVPHRTPERQQPTRIAAGRLP